MSVTRAGAVLAPHLLALPGPWQVDTPLSGYALPDMIDRLGLREMKPIRALAAIVIGLILVAAGFAESNLPAPDVSWLVAVSIMAGGLIITGVGLVGLGLASSE